jgi:NADH-quinone oxidoreductase subunit N
VESEDVTALAGLNQRSPLLAATMTLAMVSLAGVPPLAGFFGKFLLLKSVLEQGAAHPSYYCLTFIALGGVVISLYYYFGIVRAIYWSQKPADLSPITMSKPIRVSLYGCVAGMFYLGLFPGGVVNMADRATKGLQMPATAARTTLPSRPEITRQ